MVTSAIPVGDVRLPQDFWDTLHPKRFRRWVSTQQLAQDSIRLAGMLPADTFGVVAIPRSGMIPASIIATTLDIPLGYLVDGKIVWLQSGSRAMSGGKGPIAVVDDTVWAGRAMWGARRQLQHVSCFYAAVYATPHRKHLVDAYVAEDLGCHWEWNWFNNGSILAMGIATDMDGILCQNPRVPDADDGQVLEDYRQWLVAAPPRWLIRSHAARVIVTGRLERFRPETEDWLRRHRVRYEKLVMCRADAASRRGDVAEMKAVEYSLSGASFFVESERDQAERIHQLTGKCVICPDAALWF